jgi:POT family proton-dependent oligopeptide transporter
MSAPVSSRPDAERAEVAGVATDSTPPHADRRFFGHPRGLATLFFTEMWERFSYYGLRPLLVLFMSATIAQGGYGFDRDQASAIVGIYGFSVYLASLPGGWVADRLLGPAARDLHRRLPHHRGHLSIGSRGFAAAASAFFLGLVLIVLGTGCSSRTSRRSSATCTPRAARAATPASRSSTWGINVGAFAGQLITGRARREGRAGTGASAPPGVGMLFGLVVFCADRAARRCAGIGDAPARHPTRWCRRARERT